MNQAKPFLITGADGQLGKEFVTILENRGIRYRAYNKSQLDITDRQLLRQAIADVRPQAIINCAAYNLVEDAEEKSDQAFQVNSEAVDSMAMLGKEFNAVLVHFGSDYVFDGKKDGPYVEDDAPNPLNTYGNSKLIGEQNIVKHGGQYLIFRVSWVFGSGAQNFLYKLSQLAKHKDSLQVVDDEFSVPTFTRDIVEVVLSALRQGLRGIWHLTNSGQCSRYEWATYYFKKSGLKTAIQPVSSDFFQSKVKRPLWTCMSNGKIVRALNREIPTWQNAVDRFVKNGLVTSNQQDHS